jgi:hypothetical protein
VFFGIAAALVYLVVRRWVPGRGVVKGVVFGLGLLVIAGPVVLDGNYEYFRYISTWQAVALFAALYPLFGAVIGFLAERWAARPQGPPDNRLVAVAGWAVLAVILVRGGVTGYLRLRDVYHLIPS